jgi:AcrR family transcriptional regulator
MRSKIITDDQRRSFIETARRAQIIDRAIQTIAELGYGQASLAQIAKRAGISAGVISYYFAGKDDLIREVVAHIFAEGEAFIRPRVIGQPGPRETLRAFIEAHVDFSITHPAHVAAMVEMISFARVSRAAGPYDRRDTVRRFEALTEILGWGQRTGVFRAFSIPIMAQTIIEAIDIGACDGSFDAAALSAELVTLFDLATRAVPPPTGDA